MRYIAHRGNITGPNPARENQLKYIDFAIDLGYDVEIDIRSVDNQLYSGHDDPQYKIDEEWIQERSHALWIHCKNKDALIFFNGTTYNYFWHQNDHYTLTSKNFIWTYPNISPTPNSIIVTHNKQKQPLDVAGICSDYIGAWQ
jgi:hypothetical protein